MARARVVAEEAAGGAGLEEVVVPPVEAEPGAGVAEVDRAVGGLDRRVREPEISKCSCTSTLAVIRRAARTGRFASEFD